MLQAEFHRCPSATYTGPERVSDNQRLWRIGNAYFPRAGLQSILRGMKPHAAHFRSGVALTALLAIVAIALERLPGIAHLGPLSVALLLGLAWRAFNHVPLGHRVGIGFSAKTLLRLGIVLLGVRLNLELVAHAGLKVLVLDISVITAGLLGITWLGRRLGLDPTLACLIAVDSSICGASAVAAAAPALRAREDEMALVIPMCSLIGTVAMLGFTFAQQVHPLSTAHYGLMTGATLHEVAQVMAAVNPIPEAVEIGTMTKLTRVVLLVPAVFVLGWWTARRNAGRAGTTPHALPKPWFVLGFLLVGGLNTLGLRYLPEQRGTLQGLDQQVLTVANFLMAMAMAGMGLQVDLRRLRTNGLRSLVTAVVGWLALAGLAATEIALLT